MRDFRPADKQQVIKSKGNVNIHYEFFGRLWSFFINFAD